MSVDLVASMYQVMPESVLNRLYRKRSFCYTEAKKRGQKAIEAGFRKAMGLTAQDLQEQRTQAWVRLFDSGMTVEAIADIYKLKASTVRNAIRKATDVKVPSESALGNFDWRHRRSKRMKGEFRMRNSPSCYHLTNFKNRGRVVRPNRYSGRARLAQIHLD